MHRTLLLTLIGMVLLATSCVINPLADDDDQAIDSRTINVEGVDAEGVDGTDQDNTDDDSTGDDDAGPGVSIERLDDDAELQLASTPAFCEAAGQLIGSMETVGAADIEAPNQLRLAYETTEAGLFEVLDVAPNPTVHNDVAEVIELFTPVASVLRDADWDVEAIDLDAAADLAIFDDEAAARLEELGDGFEAYGRAQCGLDIEDIRRRAVDDFEYQFVDTAPEPIDDDDVDLLALLDDGVPAGVRGGDGFCRADRVWLTGMSRIDDADGDQFFDRLVEGANIYTTWGERIPADLAVATLDLSVGFSEVVATIDEDLNIPEIDEAYRTWRASDAYRQGRAETDTWVAANC